MEAGANLHGRMEDRGDVADEPLVQRDRHFQIEIRGAENDSPAMVQLSADGGDGGDQSAVAVCEDEERGCVGFRREFGQSKERCQVGQVFIPLFDVTVLAGRAAVPAEVQSVAGDVVIGEPLHEMRIATGVFAVAVEDGDAGDGRGWGLRGVVAELGAGGGDGLGLDFDSMNIRIMWNLPRCNPVQFPPGAFYCCFSDYDRGE